MPKHFNDDRLGRALDKYHQTGTTKIFTAIALKAAHKFQVKMNSIHIDGSLMYVHGAYRNESEVINKIEKEATEADTEIKPIEIVHAYSFLSSTRSQTIHHRHDRNRRRRHTITFKNRLRQYRQ